MSDLETAKRELPGHTICLCRDGDCIYSDKKGIAPMMGFIAEGMELGGYSAADLIVGKAAALLFVRSGIVSVFAKVLSEKGKSILEKYGVYFEYETLTDKIVSRDGTDICPMEKTVSGTDSPDEAYELLLDKIRLMNTGKAES